MAYSVDAVYDLIDSARGVLTYEEREALADALLAGAQAQRRSRDASVRRRYCVVAGKGSVLRARASVQAV